MKVIPIFLKVDQKPVLVVGHGQMAEAKVNLLSSMEAKVKWLTLGAKITAPYGDNVEIIEQKYAEKYLRNIICMFIATDDAKLIETVLVAAQARGIIYNLLICPKFRNSSLRRWSNVMTLSLPFPPRAKPRFWRVISG